MYPSRIGMGAEPSLVAADGMQSIGMILGRSGNKYEQLKDKAMIKQYILTLVR